MRWYALGMCAIAITLAMHIWATSNSFDNLSKRVECLEYYEEDRCE